MKKILFAVTFFAFTLNASAQWSNFLSNAFGKLTSSSTTQEETTSEVTSAIKNVLGDLIGSSLPMTAATIEGTWNYEGTSCVLESDQALAELGGSVAAGKIEEKLDTYLAKVGVAPGSCTFAFLDGDSCVFTVNGRSIGGNYSLNSEDKTVAMSFYGRLNMTAHVSYNLSELDLVFNADRLLELIKKVTSTVSSKSDSVSSMLAGAQNASTGTAALSTLSTVSALLDSYTGMMLGMKLKK